MKRGEVYLYEKQFVFHHNVVYLVLYERPSLGTRVYSLWSDGPEDTELFTGKEFWIIENSEMDKRPGVRL